MDETANVTPALRQVEQHVGDPLARSVIGVTSAAAGFDDFETRVEQLGRGCAGSRGIDRRMLEQPDELARFARRDRGVACFLPGEGEALTNRRGVAPPFDLFGESLGNRQLSGESRAVYQEPRYCKDTP
jgi:hypothetical protein